jgi:hypothetical protein
MVDQNKRKEQLKTLKDLTLQLEGIEKARENLNESIDKSIRSEKKMIDLLYKEEQQYNKTLDLAVKKISLEEQAKKEIDKRQKLLLREKDSLEKIIEKEDRRVATGKALGKVFETSFKAVRALFVTMMEDVERTFQLTSNINKEFGAMGEATSRLASQAKAAGVQFSKLGLGFETGAAAVTEMASTMMQIRLPRETVSLGLKLSEYVGLGAKGAGELLMTFQRTGAGIKTLDKAMAGATKFTKEYGVAAGLIRKDIGRFPEVLARFGTANVMEFSKSAAVARTYGLTIGQVNKTFGQNMDTFDKTSDVATKLNAVFGTQINSLELMMETDPTKRMEMVRKSLMAQRIEYDKLNPFQKNMIKNTLGISDVEAQRTFGSEKARKAIMLQQKEAAKQAKIDREWTKGMSNMRRTLINVAEEFGVVKRAIVDLMAKFLGFNNTQEGAVSIAKILREVFDQVAKGIRTFSKSIDPTKDNLVNLKEVTSDIFDIVTGTTSALITLKETWDDLFGGGIGTKLAGEIEAMAGGKDVSTPWKMLKGVFGVDDALITKKGEVVKFNPNDNILAMKDLNKLNSGNDGQLQSEIRSLKQSIEGLKQAYSQIQVKIETADINIDGRKVGEAQLKIARAQT